MRSQMLSRRGAGALLFLVAALALIGCGGGNKSRGHVSGKVTVAGKGPLTGGSITFISLASEAEMGGGIIKSDGTFDVVDAPVGECKVVVSNAHLNLAGSSGGMGGGMPGGMGGGMPGGMGGGMPGRGGPSGPKAADKDKMGTGPKGADIDPKMGESKDTGASKFMKIDADFGDAAKTTLRHTVTRGDTAGVNFDIK